jgi:ABC-type branched-subunit amino acid transport system substrate-binding protein
MTLPVQYEELEASPYIFYTGATTNQQIIPALDYLKQEGVRSLFLVGYDYVFPRTANKEIKAYASANGMEIKGERIRAVRLHRFLDNAQQGEICRGGRGVQHSER